MYTDILKMDIFTPENYSVHIAFAKYLTGERINKHARPVGVDKVYINYM